ncbi:unnamed protein product, partial [Rotaria sp. Silwood2]
MLQDELKALYIVGPSNEIAPEIGKLYKENENCLVIGDGTASKPLTFEDIKNKLEENNFIIGPNTRIDILAHGERVGNKHRMQLDSLDANSCCYTEDFFKKLRELANYPLYVHLWSCYGGSANKDTTALGNGSILVTHVEAKEVTAISLEEHALQASLSRYLEQNILTPYQQFILDFQENFEAMTFNKVAGEQTLQFKSKRIPKDQ